MPHTKPASMNLQNNSHHPNTSQLLFVGAGGVMTYRLVVFPSSRFSEIKHVRLPTKGRI